MDLANIRDHRVLVVVAHADDETLFCGGTIAKLTKHGNKVDVMLVTAVSQTNGSTGGDEQAERQRQRNRLQAYVKACAAMGANPIAGLEQYNCHEDTKHYERHAVIDCVAYYAGRFQPKYDLAITHGLSGEYGHVQHVLTHLGIVKGWIGKLLVFDDCGPICVEVDATLKRSLLDLYRYGCTQTPEWNPTIESNPKLAAWLGDTERFSDLSV